MFLLAHFKDWRTSSKGGLRGSPEPALSLVAICYKHPLLISSFPHVVPGCSMCFKTLRTVFRTKKPRQHSVTGSNGTVPVNGHPDTAGSDWKTTAWNAANVTLRLVKESADAFPPLKAVAGGLCELINNFEVGRLFRLV